MTHRFVTSKQPPSGCCRSDSKNQNLKTGYDLSFTARDYVELECQPGVIRKRGRRSLLAIGKRSLFLLGMLALSNLSIAAPNEFKLVYAQVPGIEKALAGDIDLAIADLELRARDPFNDYMPDELSTLCALYVVTGKLEAGRKTCNAAVENDESDAAYNNRGVLRARLGDVAGAMRDLERARVLPDNQQRYIEELVRTDARLIASSNYAVVTKYAETRGRPDPVKALTGRVRGASVEDLSN